MATQQDITILGSTGSIGTQTLDVIESHSERFRARILTAGRNWQLLAEQALRHRPDMVVIGDESALPSLRQALQGSGIGTAAGPEAIAEAARHLDNDIVVGAMVGYSGLKPVLNALQRGKTVALANKETLVAAGEIVTDTAKRNNASIIPVDSEHSAIFQCLQGERHQDIRKLILTASGGPFRLTPREQLRSVTPQQALKHPNWDMGAKVTIDSASMMNKGFEMIEARWLFDIRPDDINILVHPESVVHSLVEFIDGSVKAQMADPDMRMPIRYALGYPDRLPAPQYHLSLADHASLSFFLPDMEKFPLLRLAFDAVGTGGTAPTLLNAANEVAVKAFLQNQIAFTDLYTVADRTLQQSTITNINSLDDISEAHRIGTETASAIVENMNIHHA